MYSENGKTSLTNVANSSRSTSCFLQIKLGPARTRKWGQHANMQCISTSPVLVAKTHSKTGPVSEISGPQRFCPKLISQFLPAGAAATL